MPTKGITVSGSHYRGDSMGEELYPKTPYSTIWHWQPRGCIWDLPYSTFLERLEGARDS